jgi:hypothetical protein
VLVKFYFTNIRLLPRGILLKPRREEDLEKKHRREGEQLGIPRGGLSLTRPGRVDTGRHEEYKNVDIFPLWKKLKESHVITDVHCFFQKRSEGMKKFVVVVNLVPRGKVVAGRKMVVVEELENNLIRGSIWGIVHIWTNPNGVLTVNCLQRQPR